MVKLQELPTELLSHIVSYVAEEGGVVDGGLVNGDSKDDWESIDDDGDEGDDDTEDGDEIAVGDLYNLCLVSHQFRSLAQPLMFRDFEEDILSRDSHSLISFTRTVTLRPDLGESVRSVDATPLGCDMLPDLARTPAKEISSTDLEVFTRAVQNLNVGSEEQQWLKAIGGRDLSVFLALLLSKTPNVTTMALPAGELFMKPISHLFTEIPSFLSKLGSIILAADQLYSAYNLATYSEFFPLPLLKDLMVDYGDLVEANCPQWEPSSLSIESILFKMCHLDSGSMQRLVQGCKKLTTFALTNFSPNPRRARFDANTIKQFTAAELYTELLAHKETLDTLHLEENHSDSTTIGSLHDFVALESLTIQHRLLPPKPELPASLKTLYITDCNTSIRNMTQHIADECRKGLLPALKTFKVLALDITQPIKLPGQRIPNGQTPEQCFLSIRNKFNGTNVEFQICPYVVQDDEDDEDDEDDYYDGMDPDMDPDSYEYNYGSDDDSDDFGPMGGSRMASALLQALTSEGYDMRRMGALG